MLVSTFIPKVTFGMFTLVYETSILGGVRNNAYQHYANPTLLYTTLDYINQSLVHNFEYSTSRYKTNWPLRDNNAYSHNPW